MPACCSPINGTMVTGGQANAQQERILALLLRTIAPQTKDMASAAIRIGTKLQTKRQFDVSGAEPR